MTANTNFPAEAVERLANRILAGEVVFFIGAGFSLDSEGNSAKLLIARLLARFYALIDALNALGGKERDKAEELKKELEHTFSLIDKDKENYPELLVAHYYPVNDWFCSAFGELINHIKREDLSARIDTAGISSEEYRYLQIYSGSSKPIPLMPIDLDDLLKFSSVSDAGKALFLDTMGFNNPAVMGGQPRGKSLTRVKKSYGDRLLDRHHVLARLAMEGWCPLLLTTNYDLLLEGAYRLAGMWPRKGGCNSPRLAYQTYGHFHRIAAARDYFASGAGHRTAQIVKMHGCVDAYRECRKEQEKWQAYLPAMVFTYREIQHWREDAWSRDMLRSILRTRTVAFCSYSTQDPVIHDTIRSVYEEMNARRPAQKKCLPSEKDRPDPAFVFDAFGQGNFHQQEILRAAAKVAGTVHPPRNCRQNLLGFHFKSHTEKAFPNIDELFRWVYHRTLRRRQQQVLDSQLPTVLAAIFGHPCHQDELDALRDRFKDLYEYEEAEAAKWDNTDDSRRRFSAICGWSDGFHIPLLREMAAAEILRTHLGKELSIRQDLGQKMAVSWYCPTLDHPDWCAWAVILEMALRQLAAHWRKQANTWMQYSPWLKAEAGDLGAQVDISAGPDRPTPVRITIGVEDLAGRPKEEGLALHKHLHWRLVPDGLPWPRQQACPSESVFLQGYDRHVPGAKALWALARNDVSEGFQDITSFIHTLLNGRFQ
ncbi:hypothetical protein BXU06_05800 [Aquaspirillum sp. LM1]|uniref:SIR2 family NAD-dependent protein deacylase n=1 Tax=Aquaspirillum sp. LM1 TaxID=1938604 RepID=UPI000983EF0D|nr:SIR2 family protein [Aquaspirillum sp. LM1]AQR64625.1 hypothetical protein BXU06_05800 [Aquaspirillum sp. LM1]